MLVLQLSRILPKILVKRNMFWTTFKNKFVQFFAKTRSQFKAVQKDESILKAMRSKTCLDILTTPGQVEMIIRSMNTKSACVPGDIPFKVMHYFARDLSVPLSNIFNTMFTEGGYPEMWKTEFITPIPKNYNSVSKMSEFRPISALYNCAKISEMRRGSL